jgi:hypothetical protein
MILVDQAWWHTPVIPSQEVEIRRTVVEANTGKKVSKPNLNK